MNKLDGSNVGCRGLHHLQRSLRVLDQRRCLCVCVCVRACVYIICMCVCVSVSVCIQNIHHNDNNEIKYMPDRSAQPYCARSESGLCLVWQLIRQGGGERQRKRKREREREKETERDRKRQKVLYKDESGAQQKWFLYRAKWTCNKNQKRPFVQSKNDLLYRANAT